MKIKIKLRFILNNSHTLVKKSLKIIPLITALLNYIKKEKLFGPAEKVLLTVSGGIDSILMCELFHKAGLKFGIAHCNFQLRAEESEADETFVKTLAKKYNVSMHSIKFNTAVYAKENKLSIQVAARQLRYQWFEGIKEHYGYNYIATAHHQDDSIETFFINLIRGTGISGLHGILPKKGNIIRPMLFTTKNEIELYVKKNKLKFREDSSNASDKYQRNKIRNQLIPLLKELNPAIRQTIADDIKRLGDTEKIYRKEISAKRAEIVKEDKHSIRISIKELKKLNPLTPYLFEFLYPLGFNSATVDEIISCLDGLSGKHFFSATHRLIKDREYLIIEQGTGDPESKKEKKEKFFFVKKNQKKITTPGLEIHFSTADPESHKLNTDNKFANLDYDKLEFPLEIRKWQKGDQFYPLGMKGKKKLSDFFIDKKLSIAEKENVWLLTSTGKIVWVTGHRIDERFKITKKTKKIYIVELV